MSMRVFIGSSKESLNMAREIAATLERLRGNNIQVHIWDEPNLFAPGEYTLESLENIAYNIDAALFIFADDDKIWYRGKKDNTVRDNVLFEYGLFAGVLSRKKVAIVKAGTLKPISDLEGINYISYNSSQPYMAFNTFEGWLNGIYAYKKPEEQKSISVMSLLDALNFAIKSGPIDTLKIFAISTTFSVKVFRSEPSLKINDAYVILRRYENGDPYYSNSMENAIRNSVGSWRMLQAEENISNLHMGFFNYHPDEGFYLIDDRILIYGMLNTLSGTNSVEFDRSVVVVKNNSATGRKIIGIYQRRFDYLTNNFIKHE